MNNNKDKLQSWSHTYNDVYKLPQFGYKETEIVYTNLLNIEASLFSYPKRETIRQEKL